MHKMLYRVIRKIRSDTQLFIQGGAKKMKPNAQDIIGWSE